MSGGHRFMPVTQGGGPARAWRRGVIAIAAAWPLAIGAQESRPPGGAPLRTAEEQFDAEADAFSRRATRLRDDIERLRARLEILGGVMTEDGHPSGARAIIVHRNELGSRFVLESVAYAVDGATVFACVDADLDRPGDVPVFNAPMVPGQHHVHVRMTFRGRALGPIAYVEGYQFTLEGNTTFNVDRGKVTTVRVAGQDAGGPTTDLVRRPRLRYDLSADRQRVSPPETGVAGPAGRRST